MVNWLRTCVYILIFVGPFKVSSQETSFRARTLMGAFDTLKLDTLTIFPNSFQLKCGSVLLGRDDYRLDYQKGNLILLSPCSDSLFVSYRVLPINLSKVYGERDSSIIYHPIKGNRDKFLIGAEDREVDIFGGSNLSKNGSISRGIAFGNNQNLAVNSSLNLELAGDIAPNLKLIASLSDNNLPIQADGNTNKLQEFDQVYIKIYNDQFNLIAGDFWLKKPEGYFMTYQKRVQGLTIDRSWGKDTSHIWTTQVSGAMSKGKFQRQIVVSNEGNQGPYRLRGNENEPFIIVLAGTESVYIDGKLLIRGQENDYVINYNSAEVIFTSRNQITKDSRIVVEFQYSDQNYARSLVQNSTTYTTKKMKFWVNAYSESDAKNQPIQQSLSNDQKFLLSSIGDSLNLARSSSIDSIGFFDNQVMYDMIDSLGYDSVLVFSVHKDSAVYRAVFQYVGSGNGNYVATTSNAMGKVYKWVVPIGGLSQGDFSPSRLLVAPKKKQMLSSGVNIQLRKGLRIESDLAYSINDINTFSSKDSGNDFGFAGRSKLIGLVPLGNDSLPKWQLESKLEVESLNSFFSPIQQYRAVEFDRDWNTRNKGYKGNQLATTTGLNFKNRGYGNINVEGQQFLIGSDYRGLRTKSNGRWKRNGFSSVWDASYLSSQAEDKNEFVRHKIEVSKRLKFLRVGFIDDHEINRYRSSGPVSLKSISYQFYDYQFYIGNADSSVNGFKLFYRERYDQRSDLLKLTPVARARTVGGQLDVASLKNQSLTLITSYRELKIQDPLLISQTPENTLLGRVDYDVRAWKGAVSFHNFYEIGSGLELKKEFLYIKVNDGQGIYTWIDYNGDGVRDLNEFEVAQYVDQASYIRVFTPSSSYTKTFSNELNQSFFWKPERIWSSKKGLRKVFSLFSVQTRIRLNRKTNIFNGIDAFNPFSTAIRDTNLLSTTSNVRNTLFFNRTSAIFGGEVTYHDLRSKVLLASGFDSRQNSYTEGALRWNIKKMITLETRGQTGIKVAEADYTTGRNYYLAYYFVKPSVVFQPSTTFRVTLDGRYSHKQNAMQYGGDLATVRELGSSFKFNRAEKGSLQATFSALNIEYSGVQNSALGFEMLEALKPGLNFTWNVGYQHSISKTLQISFQYNGRKSENSKFIHSGGMEVRAFF
jgi:hypothetical protein